LTFSWTFQGRAVCSQAGVVEVVVTLDRRGTADHAYGPTAHACSAVPFRLDDILEGDYTLRLDGLAVRADWGSTLYAGAWDLVVLGGATTDLGTVDLVRVAAVPGEVVVDWLFERIGEGLQPTPDCAAAGVNWVQVTLWDSQDNVVFDQAHDCLTGPATIQQVIPGDYVLGLEGLGTYNSLTVTLYRSAAVPFAVQDGMRTNVGAVVLPLVLGSLGNLDVAWSFAGGKTCATAGVQSVFVDIVRPGRTQPEDSFRADCTLGHVVREYFLPGDWRTLVTAVGTEGGATVNWSGQTTTNVAPGQTAVSPVSLVRSGS
jgi:hypothetical protein